MIQLSQWTGLVPVILPAGQPTLSTIGVASAGVALPFFFYIVAMFMLLVPIWMDNAESDGVSLPRGKPLYGGSQVLEIEWAQP